MNIKKITNTLGVDLNESISKIDRIMEQKQDVKHDNMEDMVIEFTNDIVETLTPTEIALILAIKTVNDVVTDQVKEFLTMVAGSSSNPLGSKLGF